MTFWACRRLRQGCSALTVATIQHACNSNPAAEAAMPGHNDHYMPIKPTPHAVMEKRTPAWRPACNSEAAMSSKKQWLAKAHA